MQIPIRAQLQMGLPVMQSKDSPSDTEETKLFLHTEICKYINTVLYFKVVTLC